MPGRSHQRSGLLCCCALLHEHKHMTESMGSHGIHGSPWIAWLPMESMGAHGLPGFHGYQWIPWGTMRTQGPRRVRRDLDGYPQNPWVHMDSMDSMGS